MQHFCRKHSKCCVYLTPLVKKNDVLWVKRSCALTSTANAQRMNKRVNCYIILFELMND